MLNKFEFVTSSPNIKSFDSCMKQNVGQLLAVQCWSPKRNSKKTDFLNMEPSESRKKWQFWKIFKIPGNLAENFRDRRFPGIPGGLAWGEAYLHTKWHLDPSSHFAATDIGRIVRGLCPFGARGAGSPSNTVWPAPRPTCMPSFILIHPTVWPQCTNVTDRTDRQDRTVAR